MLLVGALVGEVLRSKGDQGVLRRVGEKVLSLTSRFRFLEGRLCHEGRKPRALVGRSSQVALKPRGFTPRALSALMPSIRFWARREFRRGCGNGTVPPKPGASPRSP
jgi:hypothetical protein